MTEEENPNIQQTTETINQPQQQDNNNDQKKFFKHALRSTLISIGAIVLIILIGGYYYTRSHISISEAKPIIYLYPEEQMEISVKLGYPKNITCSYPNYVDGWNVIANPDGSLIDTNTGRQLYSLYWEGDAKNTSISNDGFVVKGEDTLTFLEEKLAILGLNEIEAEEFIVYWLPKLQNNKYNFIRFATMDEINSMMPLEFSVEPDSLIRVLMEYKPLDKYMEVKEQQLMTPERTGFVVVEWGGTEI